MSMHHTRLHFWCPTACFTVATEEIFLDRLFIHRDMTGFAVCRLCHSEYEGIVHLELS